jgi:hypothetical protein
VAKNSRRRYRPSLEEQRAEHARRVDRALARFCTSYMSNAKWRKALRTLAAADLGILGCRWKFVDDERVFATDVVGEQDLGESHVRDGRFQPFVYKEIEWLEVLTAQPGEATAALARVGKFAVQPCETGIRLLGYR